MEKKITETSFDSVYCSMRLPEIVVGDISCRESDDSPCASKVDDQVTVNGKCLRPLQLDCQEKGDSNVTRTVNGSAATSEAEEVEHCFAGEDLFFSDTACSSHWNRSVEEQVHAQDVVVGTTYTAISRYKLMGRPISIVAGDVHSGNLLFSCARKEPDKKRAAVRTRYECAEIASFKQFGASRPMHLGRTSKTSVKREMLFYRKGPDKCYQATWLRGSSSILQHRKGPDKFPAWRHGLQMSTTFAKEKTLSVVELDDCNSVPRICTPWICRFASSAPSLSVSRQF